MRFVTPSKILVGALLLASGLLLLGGIDWQVLAQRFHREDRSDPTGSADAELLPSGDALGAAQGSPASHSTLRDRASVDDASTKGAGVGESGHSAVIEPLVTGRVLDAFGGALLSAKIQVESDPASYAVGRGGRFRVRCERPDSLRISAPGHESVQIEVPAAARVLELGEVRLRGSASATIRVQSAAGDVLPGMRVRIASSATEDHAVGRYGDQLIGRKWRITGFVEWEHYSAKHVVEVEVVAGLNGGGSVLNVI